jgi:hypothetical protein
MDKFAASLAEGFSAVCEFSVNIDDKYTVIDKTATMLDIGLDKRTVPEIESFYLKLLQSDLKELELILIQVKH